MTRTRPIPPVGSTLPPIGSPAPDFRLPDHQGRLRSLHDFRGRWVVLYFYPEDDTPTCTTQACDLRDAWAGFREAGIEVFGISPDPVASHAAFHRKFRLPFALLADVDHKVATLYGAWGEKTLYGRTYTGMHRNTYLIDPAGILAAILPRVRTRGHAARVLAAVARLRPEP